MIVSSIPDRLIVENFLNISGLGDCGAVVVSDFHDTNALITYLESIK